jgi:RHS repeat-associated protein
MALSSSPTGDPAKSVGGAVTSLRVLLALFVVAAGLFAVGATPAPAGAVTTYTEYAGGGGANTWTNYTNAGGTAGSHISQSTPIQMTCALQGFKVADGNPWWYQIASSPWNNGYYVSADAFYNNGATSGSLHGTPWVDPAVPQCGGNIAKYETTGGVANTWSNYTNAGGTEGPQIGSNAAVGISCALQGFRVADGNTWWYQIGSAPWNDSYYVSADAFYNNGATSGSLLGTPFVDPAVPVCSGGGTTPPGGNGETTGGVAHTWTNYTNAGGTQGPSISSNQTVTIACKLTGFAVADGNTWWYQIASSPWNGQYFVSADAFYNNGATSGSLLGTPFVDPSVPVCTNSSTPHPAGETVGNSTNTWANYSHAGAAQGPTIPAFTTVSVSCRVTGFQVQDGNTWWYLVSSSPWNNDYYASADAFYNNGATSGSLHGTPFDDPSVPVCVGNHEAAIYTSAYGSSSASIHSTGCVRADPVDCASGDFWQSFTDASIPGRGPGLVITRTYNDLRASSQGIFGNGWSSSYDQHLTLGAVDGSVAITLSDGSEMIAEPNGSGGYTLPPSTGDSFSVNGDGTYTLTERATKFLTFSSTGLLVSLEDLNGYQTTLAYNGSSQLISATDSSGRVLQVNHGANGDVSSVVDPMGRTTSYTYDSSGNLVSVTDPMGRVTSFTYDGSSQMLSMTDPRGGVVSNTYDSDGRVTAQTDPAGRTTTFSYTGDNFSSLGGTTTITDPLGNVEVEKYDNGFLTQAIKAYGTSDQATTTFTYDPNTYGTTSQTDPNGNVTVHTYDANGNLLSTTDPLGRTTTYTYNSLNEVLTSTSPQGETMSDTYDNAGNPLSTTDGLGQTTQNIYADPGDIGSVTDAAGEVTGYTYDAYGDRNSVTTHPSLGVADTTASSFDLDGEQVCVASPNAIAAGVSCPLPGAPRVADTTTTAYDADGESTSVTDPMSNVTTTTYDGDGNKLTQTDPEGNVTSYAYDQDNELVSTTKPGGATVLNSYDADGNVTSTTDGDGHATKNTYNTLNQQTSSSNPLGQTTNYTYDLVGNRLTTNDPSGRVTTDTYNADNELTGVSYSDGTTHGVTYSYNSDGKRTAMTDGTGTTTYTYDALERLVSSTDGAGSTVVYAYDLGGHLTSMTYPNGKAVTNAYDGAGEETTVTDWLGNSTAFTYDHDGNELSASVFVAKKGSNHLMTSDAYAYNADDQVQSITDTAGATTIQAFTYSRNADSLVNVATRTGANPQNFSYDATSELTSDALGSYAYDPAGNLTASLNKQKLTYNAADELVTSSVAKKKSSYTYNAEEERTSSTAPLGTSVNYSYDQADRLIGLSEGSTLATYSYNGDGLRMSKTVDAAPAVQFTWNTVASTPLLLADGANSYIYGPGNVPLEAITAAGKPIFYHHNQLGSTTLITSATGSAVATYSYDSYGTLLSESGSVVNPLLYAGQYLDSESGLYYLQARYYDPTTSQFLSGDPIVQQTGVPYGYAGDDPTNNVDPDGESWWSVATTVLGVVGTAAGIAGAVISAPEDAAAAAILTGIAVIAAGTAGAIGIAQVIYGCIGSRFVGSCSGNILKNDLQTLVSILPGKPGGYIGDIDEALSFVHLGPIDLASATSRTGQRTTGNANVSSSTSSVSHASPC